MFLLQMAGFPGSGKSTMASKIEKHTDSIVIDRDVIKTSLLDAGIKDPLLTELSYKVSFDLVEYYLGKGRSVIIDTSCYLEETLKKGLKLSEKYGVKYKYIECKVDSYEEIESRIKNRRNLSSQLKQVTIEKYKEALGKSLKPKNMDSLIINTTRQEDYNMEEVLDYLMKK